MRPHEIERIAQAVSVGLVQSPAPMAPAGCGSFSNTQAFTCPDYECSANYECGGVAEFACGQTFSCPEGFFCSCVYSTE
jgi:hypothetical protein